MKIAMISEHASPLASLGGVDAGGQNVYVDELSAALAQQGHDVTVYTRRDAADLQEQVRAPRGYRVVHVPAGPPSLLTKDEILPHMDEFGRFLGSRWAGDQPDVVHAHFWMSGLAALRAARQNTSTAPIVQTFHALGTVKRRHQGDRDSSPPQRVHLERLVGLEVSRIAATCSSEVFELARMGVPGSRVSVVPCGVDLSLFNPQGPVAPRSRPRRVLAVGRLVPRKGFGTAIAALRLLPDTELVIAGGPAHGLVTEDAEAQRLMILARELGVGDRVRMVGLVPQQDMPALLRSADVVVCTPDYEPFGIVPLEAMACGIPVVVSAVGGLTDTVVDGLTGILVPPRRPEAVAAALGRLLNDQAMRNRYGAAGGARARTRYSWDRIARELLSVYQRARQGTTVTAEQLAGSDQGHSPHVPARHRVALRLS
jgi:glycosyltransferase involved in cell wall biosynthesis